MDKEIIDRGTYYGIKDYEPIVEFDKNGNVVSIINCPYIPKFLVDGDAMVSTGVDSRDGNSVGDDRKSSKTSKRKR